MVQSYDPEKPYSRRILEIISQTWDNRVLDVQGYPVIKDFFGSPYFMEHVDGIGTKGLLHFQRRSFKEAATDAFAMNVNDLAILGFQPRLLNCHLLLQEENNDISFQIITQIASLCKKYRILYTGGETAILNTISGLEIGIHVSGTAQKLINTPLEEGDLVYGHPSSGIHSNGLTLARRLLKEEILKYLDVLTTPTEIYLGELNLTDRWAKKRMHITGGAFTKLKKLLNNNLGMKIDLTEIKTPRIFQILFERLKQNSETACMEMLRTFNCGIGFIEIVDPLHRSSFEEASQSALLIGKVTNMEKGRVQIKSSFENVTVEI
ncbi:MAG: AIR synthase-related protein [Candidatus Heimdallarchaeota archaeon]